MPFSETTAEMRAYRNQIADLRAKMRALLQASEPQEVQNYQLATGDGTVSLADLFGDKEYLFVVHNMGAGCVHCTVFADGLNGILPHLESRAAVVVSSPNDPETQHRFKTGRGWNFRMVSHQGTSFASDLGYANGDDYRPGVSVFKKSGDRILRVSSADFGAGEDYSTPGLLLELLPDGAAGWEPKFRY